MKGPRAKADTPPLSGGGCAASLDRVEISSEALRALACAEKMMELGQSAYRLSRLKNMTEEEIRLFCRVLAKGKGARNAKAFLKTLGGDELSVVKKAGGSEGNLNRRRIEALSEKAARSLITQPDYSLCGTMPHEEAGEPGWVMAFRFPPENAPEKVKDAWVEAVDPLPEEERLLAPGLFWFKSASENIRMDAKGGFLGCKAPGDADYKDIFPGNLKGWAGLLGGLDEELAFVEAKFPGEKERVQKDRALMETFKRHLLG